MSDIPPTPAALFVCPFCGGKTPDQPRCAACNGPLDPLSRQATQNSMGPWFIRDEQQPYRPGCSYDTVLMLIARGRITLDTILRGPTTSQFWYPARRVPGVAYRFGICHSCQADVSGQTGANCSQCGTELLAEPDRQFLGLMPIRHIPGQGAPVSEVAQPETQTQTVLAPPNTHVPPANQPVLEPRRRAVESRLEAEIQALRNRMGVLVAIAAACLIVALVAVVMSVQSRKAAPSASGSATVSAGLGQSTPLAPGLVPAAGGSQQGNPPQAGAENNESESSSETENRLQNRDKGGVPADPGTPSPDLQSLRQTRWP